MAGCSSVSKPEPAPSPKPVSLGSVSAGLDQIDKAVAASVQVAREMNKAGKPDKVEGELSVAAANLPKPDQDAVNVARSRADKATSSEYEAQRQKAQAKAAQLEKEWAELGKQVRENQKILEQKDGQIKELKLQVEAGKKDIWTITGAGLVVIGGLAMGFASWKMGAPLLLAGAFCGAIPYTLGSPAFAWTAGATLASCCALFIWWVFDKVRDNINENEPPQKVQNR
jgi:hypothetical protein